MIHPERIYFDFLKKKIILRFQEKESLCSNLFSEWNGKTIESFQTDLQEKVNGRISTRWFYDHLKSNNEAKIPRIDILNLLSEYCGFESWEDYKNQQEVISPMITESISSKFQISPKIVMAIAGTFLLFIIFMVISSSTSKKEFTLHFVDADFGIPIASRNLNVSLLNENQEVIECAADSIGQFTFPDVSSKLNFIVRADYFQSDTLEILTGNKTEETIKLKGDDYSFFIHQISLNTSDNWERRRSQLNKMIHEDAIIILVASNNQGIEMYNKWEFIDRMTMPISSLKNLRILQTEYANKTIIKMRITQEHE